MKRAIAVLVLLCSAAGLAQPKVDVAAALKTVAPDLDQRLARFKPVRMPYNSAALSVRERQMIDQLVIALRELENMYWRQSDPDGLALYNALEGDTTPRAQKLRRYLFINGSRFDLVDNNKPFVGTAPMPPGHALYPADLTRAEIEAYVATNPARKAGALQPLHASSRGQGPAAPTSPPSGITQVRRIRRARPRPRCGKRRRLSDDRGVRELPAPARRRAAHRRLLRQRHRLARSEESEVRRHLRALRDVSRRPARREDVVRRVDPDPQRGREPEARAVSAVRPRHPGRAAARGRGSSVGARPRDADGSDGRAASAPAICATATRPSPTICRTIRAFTRRRARRRSSSRTSWTRA